MTVRFLGMNTQNSMQRSQNDPSENGIIVPAILWWMGVPLSVVLILWLVF